MNKWWYGGYLWAIVIRLLASSVLPKCALVRSDFMLQNDIKMTEMSSRKSKSRKGERSSRGETNTTVRTDLHRPAPAVLGISPPTGTPQRHSMRGRETIDVWVRKVSPQVKGDRHSRRLHRATSTTSQCL